MRFGKREVSHRLTSITLPTVLGTGGGGATWTTDEGERSRARSVLQLLEDRRVLYNPFEAEVPAHCITSVQELRSKLQDYIRQCQSAELRDPLRAIQAACRQFLTEAEAVGSGRGHLIDIQGGGTSSWLFNQALGTLRAHVGVSVAVIVTAFDIDIDEHLTKILPPSVDDQADEA